jgi:hypothetical protein
MKYLILILSASCLPGCAITEGIGTVSATAGYTSPTTGIVYGIEYTKRFGDGKTLAPLKGLKK